jgi:oligoribonuclease
MSDRTPAYYLWWDCETTGLDHVMDPMLEIACIVTTPQLEDVPGKTFHTLIELTDWGKERIDENEYVKNMHTSNGLLSELQSTHPMTMEAAEAAVITMLKGLPNEGPIHLAGTGVSAFDKQVIANQMPKLNDVLDYRTLDIGQVRRFLKYVVCVSEGVMPPEADDQHRAMGDVMNALEQGRTFQELLVNFIEGSD